MFSYDSTLAEVVSTAPQTVPDVVQVMEGIDSTCQDGDGLKWFNWLYLRVTRAVQQRIDSGGFANAAWIAQLDVVFAQFYFSALREALSGGSASGCWQSLFAVRNQPEIARIQFALAGMNAHINHDLPQAVLALCRSTEVEPAHGSPQYSDFTALNSTLDSLIDLAKQTLHVRLLGDALPPLSRLEDTLAAWSVSAAREAAWNNAELLWHLRDAQLLASSFLNTLDGLTALASKTLLVPVA